MITTNCPINFMPIQTIFVKNGRKNQVIDYLKYSVLAILSRFNKFCGYCRTNLWHISVTG